MTYSGASPGSFELTKWYIDVVDPCGRSAIAYWSSLRWGPLVVRWEDLSIHAPAVSPVHRSGLGSGAGPARTKAGGATSGHAEIVWGSATLECDVRCRPWTGPFGARLLETDGGTLDWTCEAAAASVELAAASAGGERGAPLRLAGEGYAERLALTVAPWKLPISELRWGHWACPASRRSVVWIDWRGPRPLTLVLVNGLPAADVCVDDERVRTGSSELLLSETRMLHARTLADVLGGLRAVAGRLPASWRSLEDRKWISRGAVGAETGWAIHETVRFP